MTMIVNRLIKYANSIKRLKVVHIRKKLQKSLHLS